jgi:hypothetical protein
MEVDDLAHGQPQDLGPAEAREVGLQGRLVHGARVRRGGRRKEARSDPAGVVRTGHLPEPAVQGQPDVVRWETEGTHRPQNRPALGGLRWVRQRERGLDQREVYLLRRWQVLAEGAVGEIVGPYPVLVGQCQWIADAGEVTPIFQPQDRGEQADVRRHDHDQVGGVCRAQEPEQRDAVAGVEVEMTAAPCPGSPAVPAACGAR